MLAFFSHFRALKLIFVSLYYTMEFTQVVNDNLLHNILTTMFTYREQCYLMSVCKKWREAILCTHYNMQYTMQGYRMYMDNLNACFTDDNGPENVSIDSVAHIECAIADICEYLALPACRLIFVEPAARAFRRTIINSVAHYYEYSIYARTYIDALYRKIDTRDISIYTDKMHEYWALTHEDVIIK